MSKITDHLLSTERVLWQGKPDLKAYTFSGMTFAAIIVGVVLIIGSLIYLLPAVDLQNLQPRHFPYFIPFLGGLGLTFLPPLIKHSQAKATEYLVTNQRVFIKPNPHGKGSKIINLIEVNGKITVSVGFFEWAFRTGTGSIYVPTPYWHDVYTRDEIRNPEAVIIPPDIMAVKEPRKVQKIIQEAIETGKRTKWKQDKDFLFR